MPKTKTTRLSTIYACYFAKPGDAHCEASGWKSVLFEGMGEHSQAAVADRTKGAL